MCYFKPLLLFNLVYANRNVFAVQSQPAFILNVMGKFKKQTRLSLPFHHAEKNNMLYYFELVFLQRICTY